MKYTVICTLDQLNKFEEFNDKDELLTQIVMWLQSNWRSEHKEDCDMEYW